MDLDGDGNISFDEFVAMMTGPETPLQRRCTLRIREMREAFYHFDRKEVGSFHASDVLRVLHDFGVPCTPEQALAIIRNADTDDNDALEIHEFVRTVVDDEMVGEEGMKEQAADAILLAQLESEKIDRLIEALDVPSDIRMKAEMALVKAYLLDEAPVVEYFLKEQARSGERVLWQLCRYATCKHYKDGEFLFQQEDPTTELFVILRGSVKVSVEKELEEWQQRKDVRVSAWADLSHMLMKYITGFSQAQERCQRLHEAELDIKEYHTALSLINEGLHEVQIIKTVTEENLRHDLEDVLAFPGITNNWVKFLGVSERLLKEIKALGKLHFSSIAASRLCRCAIGDFEVNELGHFCPESDFSSGRWGAGLIRQCSGK